MAFTTTQLTALETAIAMGQLSVQYDGKKVEYRSMGDLLTAYNFVKASLIASGVIAVETTSNRGPASVANFSRD
ncbi:hypothetical protein [Herbaspirillum sp. ST 5-3]|uniref:phage head-tail joining protein n=1 Tax=Oxalobacteraceae TaxID=75682 RepID=UPI0010A41838|nr:hypothetical protein [Herbaspirillum sp. ST 5-3]